VAPVSELLSELRGFGLPMGGSYPPTPFTNPETNEDHTTQLHIGWTTDESLADKAREVGATVTAYTSKDSRFNGWEITVRVIR
jgi:hypothetical protein